MRLLFFCFLTLQLYSQKNNLDTVYYDCTNARELNLAAKYKINKTIAPKGFGNKNEISSAKQNSKYTFEKEHNSAWYKLNITISGILTFSIIPNKHDDDYDFMLFKKATNTNFCDSLIKHKISPVRACISRNKNEIKGVTGLKNSSSQEFVKKGVASSFAKSIDVQRGEVYYLVLDNVYENGEGHSIEFEINSLINIKGIVTDEENTPVVADIAITNQKGDTIALQKTDSNGAYNLKTYINKFQTYNLNFYNDKSFSFTKNFTSKDSIELKSLNTILPKLKKGKKHSVGAINFYGGSSQYLPSAMPAINNLLKLLKKNPNLKIVIIGHSNGRDNMNEMKIIEFTKKRANSIKSYLVFNGIEDNRIEIDGKGDHEMLFKLPQATEKQQEENRRVEISVLEF